MPNKPKTIWKIYPPFLLITVLSVLAVGLFVSGSVSDFEVDRTADDLFSRAIVIGHNFKHKLSLDNQPELDEICKQLGRQTHSRITIILANGTVAGDTNEDPFRMEKHDEREEVLQAKAEGRGQFERVSATLGERHLYVAIPVFDKDENLLGYVRVSKSIEDIAAEQKWLNVKILLGIILAAFFASIVSIFVSKGITRPLQELEKGARKFSNHELDYRISESGSREIAALSSTMNTMAEHLSKRIRQVEEHRNESEAILTSLHEGVLAFDTNGILMKLNSSASEVLGISASFAIGKTISDITRNMELQEFVEEVFQTGEYRQKEISFRNPKFSNVLLGGSPIKDTSGSSFGTLIVLNNVTQIRKLENVRKDFVANVSHELKTPITSIKGFCESLLEGALEEPEVARKFVGIVASQADRLNAIINDLLSLSQLEKMSSTSSIDFNRERISSIIDTAVEICSHSADEKGIAISKVIKADVHADVNFNLLEQALTNLLENSVKYSESGRNIEVSLSQTEVNFSIKVTDNGIGIAQEHLPRIFERFYRVDKARTRKQGGTGLGLAIVKHISLVHGGSVSVKSEVGKGSEFTITIPLHSRKLEKDS